MRRTSMLFSTHRSRVEQYPNRVSCIERARNAVRLRSMDRVSLRVIQPVCSRGVTGILDCIPLVLSSSEKRGCAIKCSLAGGADVTYGHRVAVFLYSSPKPNVVNAPTFATILLLKDWRPAGARQQWSNSVHHCPAFSTMASSPLFPPPLPAPPPICISTSLLLKCRKSGQLFLLHCGWHISSRCYAFDMLMLRQFLSLSLLGTRLSSGFPDKHSRSHFSPRLSTPCPGEEGEKEINSRKAAAAHLGAARRQGSRTYGSFAV